MARKALLERAFRRQQQQQQQCALKLVHAERHHPPSPHRRASLGDDSNTIQFAQVSSSRHQDDSQVLDSHRLPASSRHRRVQDDTHPQLYTAYATGLALGRRSINITCTTFFQPHVQVASLLQYPPAQATATSTPTSALQPRPCSRGTRLLSLGD